MHKMAAVQNGQLTPVSESFHSQQQTEGIWKPRPRPFDSAPPVKVRYEIKPLSREALTGREIGDHCWRRDSWRRRLYFDL